jgi:glycosyltransferase involved in cell wall biosynthesis
MKLLYDLYTTQPNAITRHHGGGVYGQAYFTELSDAGFWADNSVDIAIVSRNGLDLPPHVAAAADSANATRYAVTRPSEMVPLALAEGFDVLYSPVPYWLGPQQAPPPGSALRIKGTVHGLRTLDAPWDRYWLRYQRNPLKRTYRRILRLSTPVYVRAQKKLLGGMLKNLTGGIVTVSHHSKYQIVTEFPFVDPDAVAVVSSLDAPVPDSSSGVLPRVVADELAGRRYFLSMNANRPSKNVLRVFEALESYRPAAFSNFAYLCIGFTLAQQRYIKRRFPWVSPRTVHHPYCDRGVLHTLLSGAYGLLFPSTSEGFGYPPLEAMRLGVPALCSASTAIPETCGDAALYFQPRVYSEIVNRIVQLIAEPGLREDLIARGHQRYAAYNSLRPELLRRFGDFLLNHPDQK